MNTMFQHVLGVVLLCTCAKASTDSGYSSGASESLNSEDERFFFATIDDHEARTFYPFNSTEAIVAAGLLLLAIVALLVIFCTEDEEQGYGNSGYQDSGSSYSHYQQRKFSPYGFNWESLSILDWIVMGQEAWEKYDPYNLECQKRLICEIHQNESKFGGAANTMVQLFGYLQYAETFSLPEELKLILEEYIDASEKGKTMQKDCGEVYEACDFSVNRIVTKFSTNNI